MHAFHSGSHQVTINLCLVMATPSCTSKTSKQHSRTGIARGIKRLRSASTLLRHTKATAVHRLFAGRVAEAAESISLILEAEGVLIDHHAVHRQAFNCAFSEIGLDCANWSAPVRSFLQPVATSSPSLFCSRLPDPSVPLSGLTSVLPNFRFITTCNGWAMAVEKGCCAPSSTLWVGQCFFLPLTKAALFLESSSGRQSAWAP